MAKKKTEETGEARDYSELLKTVQALAKTQGSEKVLKQFDPKEHDIFDSSKRPRKMVVKPTGTKDADGNDITETKIEEVVRIALPFQKLIVKRRVAFMNVGKTELKCSPQTDAEKKLLSMVTKSRSDNKVEYKSKEIATRMMSELCSAELWYSEPADAGFWGEDAPNGIAKMRMKVLSPVLGDNLLPVFDNSGDLLYFGRAYKTREQDGASTKEVDNFDIYTKEGFYHFEPNNNLTKGTFTKYSYGKIPVIFYAQPEAEWLDVTDHPY
jgi:hypothetical protein